MNLHSIIAMRSKLSSRAGVTLLTLGACVTLTGCPETTVVYREPPPRRVVVYQPQPTYQPAPVVVQQAPAVVVSPAAAQLEPLVAPIALYPDPLLAVVLPAATFPIQVQQAGQFLAANPSLPDGVIDSQNWPPAVKAVVRYPAALNQLTGDPQWTESLGSAFANQPGDVMAAIQDLRAQAIAQRNLVSNAEQVVIVDGGVISIQPADPSVIYVPTYDPVVVYTGYHPLVFGEVSYRVGPWFVNGFDWGGGVIFVGDWHGGYIHGDHGWYRDRAFRYDRYHHWEHDARFGAPPRIERDHYVFARGVRGHEEELHRTMEVRHAEVAKRNETLKHNEEVRNANLHRTEQNRNQNLNRTEEKRDQNLDREETKKNDAQQRNETRKNDALNREETKKNDATERKETQKNDATNRQVIKKDDAAQRKQEQAAEKHPVTPNGKDSSKPRKPGEKPDQQ
jgi:hypothetical protein